MRPLIVLISAFLLTLLFTYTFHHDAYFGLAGRVGLAVMLLFTSIAHFVFMKGMLLMMPRWIPLFMRRTVVYITGLLEIAGAIGIMFWETRILSGYCLIIFFIALLPANIYSAQQHVNMEEGDNTGPGTHYLWFRIPLQLFLIVWTYYFTILHHY